MNRSWDVIWANVALLSASFFWGITFIAQKSAMVEMGPLTYSGLRFILGGLCLIPFAKLIAFETPPKATRGLAANFPLGVGLLALVLIGGINLQQFGLVYTTPTNSALLTSVYIFMTPIIMTCVGRRLHWGIWPIGLMMMSGIYLLTSSDGGALTTVNFGDLLSLLCAFFWAAHIIWLESMLRAGHNPIKINIGQSLICGVITTAVALAIEEVSVAIIMNHLPELFVGGILSITLGFTLQAIGQRKVPPSYAAVLLSSEALFAGLVDYFYFERILTILAYVGGLLIVMGVVLVQLLPPVKIPGEKAGQ